VIAFFTECALLFVIDSSGVAHADCVAAESFGPAGARDAT
jgi:hypothetical protein